MWKSRKIYTYYNEIHPLYPERERTMDENETFEAENDAPSLGAEMTSAFLVSAASVAGTFAAFFVIGVIHGHIKSRAEKKAKKISVWEQYSAEPQED